MRQRCDGHGLLTALRGAVTNLEAHAAEIDALNVFPVPDGDTGANMLATVRAALAEAEAVAANEAEGVHRIAAAASFGALMGARGNSGVITSQILRGFAEALEGRRHLGPLDLAHALQRASQAAYAAVGQPVEGTILTVVRLTAEAAVARAEAGGDLEAVLDEAVAAARAAVEATPALLPILREAGVVDAGGAGFYRLLQGARQGLGATPEPSRRVSPAVPLAPATNGTFGYEVVYLVASRPASQLDLDRIRSELAAIGESVVVVGDHRMAKVHVHTSAPDRALSLGLAHGILSRVTVENLDAQVARDETDRAHPAGFPTGEGTVATGEGEPAPAAWAPPRGTAPASGREPLPATAVVAVVAGEGFQAIFREFGATRVVGGGQGANPSTGELLAVVDGLAAEAVVLLPNNGNVRAAAEQAARLAVGRRVAVVPTRNPVEGLAALLAFEAGRSLEDNLTAMTAAARRVQSLAVTAAVRDSRWDGRRVRRGEIIVVDPSDALVAADRDLVRAVEAALATLRPGYELVTLYYGDEADLDEAERLAQRIRQATGGLDVEVVRGGQPHYRYFLGAEGGG
jgi:hypothetical protein